MCIRDSYQYFAGWVVGLIFVLSLFFAAGTVWHFAEAIDIVMHRPAADVEDTSFALIALGISAEHILLAILGTRTALTFGATIT